MPDANEPTPAQEEMTFVVEGLSSLSQSLTGGSQPTSTPVKLLKKDLERYNSRAKEYVDKLKMDAAVHRRSGSNQATLSPPDPISFWNVQVIE